MNADIVNTIELLTNRIRAKEDEANKLKKLVNELCVEAETDPRYPDISENGIGTLAALRSDQFYGQTLTAAIRNYLERRKASGLGAATVEEIFRAIKLGGYKFETSSDENAKISVGNAIRKTSSIFHRLPNGQYGLLVWYPSAKAPPEDAPIKRAGKRSRVAKNQSSPISPKDANLITYKDIRDVILAKEGEFQYSDIESDTKAKFPTKTLPPTKIGGVVFVLKQKGLIRQISPRSGKKGAVYAKA